MILHNAWGDQKVSLCLSRYPNHRGLCVGLLLSNGMPYVDITKSVETLSSPFLAYLDVINVRAAERFVRDYELGEPMLFYQKSGLYAYPLYYFYESRLRALCPLRMEALFGWNQKETEE